MKLKRRDFLKSIVPALVGGRQVVEDLLRGPGEEPEPGEVVQVDTPTCVTATCYPAYPGVLYSRSGPPTSIIRPTRPLTRADIEQAAEDMNRWPNPRLFDNLSLTVTFDD